MSEIPKNYHLTESELLALREKTGSPEAAVAQFCHSTVERNQLYRDTLLVAAGRAREGGLEDLAEYLELVISPKTVPMPAFETIELEADVAELSPQGLTVRTGGLRSEDYFRIFQLCALPGRFKPKLLISLEPLSEKKTEISVKEFNRIIADVIQDKGPNSPEFATTLREKIFSRGGGDGRAY